MIFFCEIYGPEVLSSGPRVALPPGSTRVLEVCCSPRFFYV